MSLYGDAIISQSEPSPVPVRTTDTRKVTFQIISPSMTELWNTYKDENKYWSSRAVVVDGIAYTLQIYPFPPDYSGEYDYILLHLAVRTLDGQSRPQSSKRLEYSIALHQCTHQWENPGDKEAKPLQRLQGTRRLCELLRLGSCGQALINIYADVVPEAVDPARAHIDPLLKKRPRCQLDLSKPMSVLIGITLEEEAENLQGCVFADVADSFHRTLENMFYHSKQSGDIRVTLAPASSHCRTPTRIQSQHNNSNGDSNSANRGEEEENSANLENSNSCSVLRLQPPPQKRRKLINVNNSSIRITEESKLDFELALGLDEDVNVNNNNNNNNSNGNRSGSGGRETTDSYSMASEDGCVANAMAIPTSTVIRTSSLVLRSASVTFARMLSSHMQEEHTKCIQLKAHCMDDIEHMLHFLFLNRLHPQSHLLHLMEVAHCYQLTRLFQHCVHMFLKNELSVENFVNAVQLFDRFEVGQPDGYEALVHFGKANIAALQRRADFQNLKHGFKIALRCMKSRSL